MRDPARYHGAFTEALHGDFSALSPWLDGPDSELRFSVYRNTVAKGLIDALAAQFPTVAKVMSEGWMREAGLALARRHPPTSAALLAYGDAFPSWLETYGGAVETPWLADLARLDEAWRRSFFAPDLEPLAADALAQLAPSQFAALAAELHPACVFLEFASGAPSLWRTLRAGDHFHDLELTGDAEAIVFLRPRLEVTPLPLTRGGVSFLTACAQRRSLAAAAEAGLAAEPGLDLTALFSTLIAGGAFARLVPDLCKD